jgi:hypothetical protein
MVDFAHQGRHTKIAQNVLRLSKPTDTTIHWKALEEHFLMVPLVFRFNHFRGKFEFFSKKPQYLKSYWGASRKYLEANSVIFSLFFQN